MLEEALLAKRDCTDAVLRAVDKIRTVNSMPLVGMVYKWRLDKDLGALAADFFSLIVREYGFAAETASIVCMMADWEEVSAYMDRFVVRNGEYLYYGPGKKLVENDPELAARIAKEIEDGTIHTRNTN